jgi:hypothetical protein
MRKERVLLEDETDATALGWGVDAVRSVEPALLAEPHEPLLRPKQPRDRAEHARLAGPGGADERDGLRADLER